MTELLRHVEEVARAVLAGAQLAEALDPIQRGAQAAAAAVAAAAAGLGLEQQIALGDAEDEEALLAGRATPEEIAQAAIWQLLG